MANQDPFGGGGQGAEGPFSKYLDPTNPAGAVQWSDGQQPSGYQGKTGNIAYLGTKILQGITQGRVSAFAKKEQEKMQTFGRVTQMMEAVRANPNVSPEVKAQVEQQYATMLGKVGHDQVKSSGALKDKGPRGAIAGTLSSVFEKMAGGPFKGDPLSVEDMSNFMGTATQAINAKDSTASAAYTHQQNTWSAGEQKVRAIAQQNGRITPTREDYDSVPEINQVRQWYQQYDPRQGQIIEQKYASIPQAGTEAWARSEYGARQQRKMSPQGGAAPTQGPQDAAPPAARQPGQGLIQIQDQQAGAAPPDARAPISPDSVARQRPGPPETHPQQQSDDEIEKSLLEMAYPNRAPKAEPTITAINPYSGQYETVPQSTTREWDKEWGRRETDKKAQALENQRGTANAFREKEFTWKKVAKTKDQAIAAQRVDEYARAVSISGAGEQLRETEHGEKEGEKDAMSKLIADAGQAGIPFSKVVDNIDEVMEKIDDPAITKHQDYILKEVARIKKQSQTTDISGIIGTPKPATDGKAAPPTARTAKPNSQDKPKISGAKKIVSAFDDEDAGAATPPARQSKTSNIPANPY